MVGSSSGTASGARRQGLYWILTIPEDDFSPPSSIDSLPGAAWVRGQLEEGAGGFRHWQCVVAFASKKTLQQVKRVFGSSSHCELTRSGAAEDYVWKDDTSCGQRFEVGQKAFSRNSRPDWDRVWECAKSGDFESIPASIRVQNYRSLRSIRSDYSQPIGVVRSCYVFWGASNTGKSRRAWEESGLDAYSKDPRTKFWDGYQGQENVVVDEFRGDIDIAHILRWTDRYPVRVEIKGSSVPLSAKKIWFTSNLDPRSWYPNLDADTLEALLRRLEITHFNKNLFL